MDLTAGSRLLACSTGDQDGYGSAVIVDPLTGRAAAVPGRAWAAGDTRLAWLDGDDYWLADARP